MYGTIHQKVYLAHGSGLKDAATVQDFGDIPITPMGDGRDPERLAGCQAIYMPRGWAGDPVAAEEKFRADRLGIPEVSYVL